MVGLGKKRRGKPRRDDAGRPQIPRQGAEKGGRGKIGRCDRRLDAAHSATGWPIQQRPQKASGYPPARCVRSHPYLPDEQGFRPLRWPEGPDEPEAATAMIGNQGSDGATPTHTDVEKSGNEEK